MSFWLEYLQFRGYVFVFHPSAAPDAPAAASGAAPGASPDAMLHADPTAGTPAVIPSTGTPPIQIHLR